MNQSTNQPVNHSTRRVAFTLIELLVVVAIIALLIAILLPSLTAARNTARLVVCGTQQREIANGVNVYASSNKGYYPPSIQGNTSGWWTLPNRLNYHSEKNAYGGVTDGLDGGYVAKRLLDYIPQAKLFFCPLSPEISDKAQEYYETGKAYILNGSYFLYWGYDGYKTQPPNYFRGPEKVSDARGAQVLTCDQLSWNEPGGSSYWNTSHSFKDGGPVQSDNPGGSVHALWRGVDPSAELPEELILNASYVDGHVEQYRVTENTTEWYHPGIGGSHPSQHYIPAAR